MICFLTTRGYDFTLQALISDATAPQISTLSYDRVLKKSTLPKATYVFTDIDRLNTKNLIKAARLYRRLQEKDCRVLNDPARVRTRFPLLRGLYRAGLNPINAYLVEENPTPDRFPVFIRVADGHDSPLSDLIYDQAELDRAIEAAVVAGVPRSAILIVEYAAEPIRPGVFRKSSVFRVGDRFIRDVNWHASSWVVKGDQFSLTDEDLYNEELDEMRKNSCAKAIQAAFDFASIDFGRADFGMVQGRSVVYEINTNPMFFGQRDHPVMQRVESVKIKWGLLLASLHAIDLKPETTAEEVEVEGLSIDAWNEAKPISRSLRFPHVKLSKEYVRRGDLTAALHHAKVAAEVHHQSAQAFSHLSDILMKQNRIDEAIEAASRAADLEARSDKTRIRLGTLLIQASRYEEARHQLLKALDLGGKREDICPLLARCQEHLGDTVDGENHAMQKTPWIRRQYRRLSRRLAQAIGKA